MDYNSWIAVGVFIGMFALLVFGVPIFICMLVAAFVGFLLIGEPGFMLQTFAGGPYSIASDYTFAVVPLFLLMSVLAANCGLAQAAFDAASKWIGKLRGGLLMATIGSSAVFGATCGASIAAAAVFSKIALPELLKYKYDKKTSLGCISVAGNLASLIPPSVGIIIISILADASIGRALVAGIMPGIVLALLLMAAVAVRGMLKPQDMPILEVEAKQIKPRPKLITVICIIGFVSFGILWAIELINLFYLLPGFSIETALLWLLNVIISVIWFVPLFLIWRMQRLGLYLYAAPFIAGIITILNLIIIDFSSVQMIFMVLLLVVPTISMLGFIYIKKMDPVPTYLRSLIPVLFVVLLVIGGMFFGVFPPTVGGAIGSVGVLIVAAIRRVGWKVIWDSLVETVVMNAQIFILIISGYIFSRFIALSGLPEELLGFITAANMSKYVLMLIIIIFYMFIGCVLEFMSMAIITVPLVYPLLTAAGFDPLATIVILVLLSEIALVTPPIGMSCYIVAGIAKVPPEDVFKGILPYFSMSILLLALLIFFPQIATFLPNLFYGQSPV